MAAPTDKQSLDAELRAAIEPLLQANPALGLRRLIKQLPPYFHQHERRVRLLLRELKAEHGAGAATGGGSGSGGGAGEPSKTFPLAPPLLKSQSSGSKKKPSKSKSIRGSKSGKPASSRPSDVHKSPKREVVPGAFLVYPDDLVELEGGPRFGMVVKVAGFVGDQDVASDEEEPLQEGACLVQWLDRRAGEAPAMDQVLVDSLVAKDRLLSVGDPVALATRPLSTLGTVVAVRRVLDLETRTMPARKKRRPPPRVYRDVPSEAVAPVCRCREGDHVIHKATGWLGSVCGCSVQVLLKLDDGTRAVAFVAHDEFTTEAAEFQLDEHEREPGAAALLPFEDADEPCYALLCRFFPSQRVLVDPLAWQDGRARAVDDDLTDLSRLDMLGHGSKVPAEADPDNDPNNNPNINPSKSRHNKRRAGRTRRKGASRLSGVVLDVRCTAVSVVWRAAYQDVSTLDASPTSPADAPADATCNPQGPNEVFAPHPDGPGEYLDLGDDLPMMGRQLHPSVKRLPLSECSPSELVPLITYGPGQLLAHQLRQDWNPGELAEYCPSKHQGGPDDRGAASEVAIDEAECAGDEEWEDISDESEGEDGGETAARREICEVVSCRTQARVRWADGSLSPGFIPATDLVPKALLNDHDFLPNDVVICSEDCRTDELPPPPPPSMAAATTTIDVTTGASGPAPLGAPPVPGPLPLPLAPLQEVGVIQAVDLAERTCHVEWVAQTAEVAPAPPTCLVAGNNAAGCAAVTPLPTTAAAVAGPSFAAAEATTDEEACGWCPPPAASQTDEFSVYELQAHAFRLGIGDVVMRRRRRQALLLVMDPTIEEPDVLHPQTDIRALEALTGSTNAPPDDRPLGVAPVMPDHGGRLALTEPASIALATYDSLEHESRQEAEADNPTPYEEASAGGMEADPALSGASAGPSPAAEAEDGIAEGDAEPFEVGLVLSVRTTWVQVAWVRVSSATGAPAGAVALGSSESHLQWCHFRELLLVPALDMELGAMPEDDEYSEYSSTEQTEDEAGSESDPAEDPASSENPAVFDGMRGQEPATETQEEDAHKPREQVAETKARGGAGQEEEEEEEDDEPFAVLDVIPQDHRFFNDLGEPVATSAVHKEWKILRRGLASGNSSYGRDGRDDDGGGHNIVVRAFECRKDLLRALIVGPPGTPYADAAFVFDLQLPGGYPQVPPKVFYHSSSSTERLNPNLYQDGKVCLSLLGTWSGPGWVPGTSSVLQVLLSVQALILVDEPFYNEPGFEKQAATPEGALNAVRYNEKARLLVLRHAVVAAAASVQPCGLSKQLTAHYRRRGPALVRSVQRVLDAVGAADGAADGGAAAAEEEAGAAAAPAASTATHTPRQIPPSGGYVRALRRLLPQLRAKLQ